MIKIFGLTISIADHALLVSRTSKKVFLVRPALSWDGRTSMPSHFFENPPHEGQIILPWFQSLVLEGNKNRKNNKKWFLFSIPFLTFSVITNES